MEGHYVLQDWLPCLGGPTSNKELKNSSQGIQVKNFILIHTHTNNKYFLNIFYAENNIKILVDLSIYV